MRFLNTSDLVKLSLLAERVARVVVLAKSIDTTGPALLHRSLISSQGNIVPVIELILFVEGDWFVEFSH